MELNQTMLQTPELAKRNKDPRMVTAWNYRDDPMLPRPFPNRAKSEMALPLHRFSYDTPDSPEMFCSPDRPFLKYHPTRLEFSPFSRNDQDDFNPIYGLHYFNCQALREKPRLITNIDIIYSSPIIQENIHHLLADHGLDQTKTLQTIRYLGLPQATFFEYLRATYPRHYWTHLGDKC